MNHVELTVRAATRAYGETVREIRPLDLTAAASEPPAETAVTSGPASELPSRRYGDRARRVKWWAAPAAAAAAMIALATSLIVVKDLSHGGRGTPAGPAAAGVPRYYVALDPPEKKKLTLADVLIGDAFTGKKVATITPPGGATFAGVTGAADDRTFVVDTMKITDNGQGTAPPITWYLLRLTPGTAPGYQMTRLPIPGLRGWGVEGIALSNSGTEIALALANADAGAKAGQRELRIYSVATGKVVRAWSTNESVAWGGSHGLPGLQIYALSWTDNDTMLAFPVSRGERLLNLTTPGGNLIADSRPMGSVSIKPSHGCMTEPLVSSGGKTAVCSSVIGPGVDLMMPSMFNAVPPAEGKARDVLRWLAYSTSAPETKSTLYQVTAKASSNDVVLVRVLWVSSSGKTLIVDWAVAPSANLVPTDSRIGVVSDGNFTPLRMASAPYILPGWLMLAW